MELRTGFAGVVRAVRVWVVVRCLALFAVLLALGQGIGSTGIADSIVIVLVRVVDRSLSEKAVGSMKGLPARYNCQIVVVDILPARTLGALPDKNLYCPY